MLRPNQKRIPVGEPTVLIEGQPAETQGVLSADSASISGEPTVLLGGRTIAAQNRPTISGQASVLVNGRPAATITHLPNRPTRND